VLVYSYSLICDGCGFLARGDTDGAEDMRAVTGRQGWEHKPARLFDGLTIPAADFCPKCKAAPEGDTNGE